MGSVYSFILPCITKCLCFTYFLFVFSDSQKFYLPLNFSEIRNCMNVSSLHQVPWYLISNQQNLVKCAFMGRVCERAGPWYSGEGGWTGSPRGKRTHDS